MAGSPAAALSDNLYSITLKRNSQPILTATVTLSVSSPDGVVRVNSVTVPHIAAGVYTYSAAPSTAPMTGTYTATWNAVDATNKTLNRVEPFVVVA